MIKTLKAFLTWLCRIPVNQASPTYLRHILPPSIPLLISLSYIAYPQRISPILLNHIVFFHITFSISLRIPNTSVSPFTNSAPGSVHRAWISLLLPGPRLASAPSFPLLSSFLPFSLSPSHLALPLSSFSLFFSYFLPREALRFIIWYSHHEIWNRRKGKKQKHEFPI